MEGWESMWSCKVQESSEILLKLLTETPQGSASFACPLQITFHNWTDDLLIKRYQDNTFLILWVLLENRCSWRTWQSHFEHWQEIDTGELRNKNFNFFLIAPGHSQAMRLGTVIWARIQIGSSSWNPFFWSHMHIKVNSKSDVSVLNLNSLAQVLSQTFPGGETGTEDENPSSRFLFPLNVGWNYRSYRVVLAILSKTPAN